VCRWTRPTLSGWRLRAGTGSRRFEPQSKVVAFGWCGRRRRSRWLGRRARSCWRRGRARLLTLWPVAPPVAAAFFTASPTAARRRPAAGAPFIGTARLRTSRLRSWLSSAPFRFVPVPVGQCVPVRVLRRSRRGGGRFQPTITAGSHFFRRALGIRMPRVHRVTELRFGWLDGLRGEPRRFVNRCFGLERDLAPRARGLSFRFVRWKRTCFLRGLWFAGRVFLAGVETKLVRKLLPRVILVRGARWILRSAHRWKLIASTGFCKRTYFASRVATSCSSRSDFWNSSERCRTSVNSRVPTKPSIDPRRSASALRITDVGSEVTSRT